MVYKSCTVRQLDETISATERTLALRGENVQASEWMDFAATLFARFERTASLEHLKRAINAVGEAIDATSEKDPAHGLYLLRLGTLLHKQDERDERMSQIHDSTRAVGVVNKVVADGDTSGDDIPTIAWTPEGESIYANTPQHHVTVLLRQGVEASDIPTVGGR
jgi:hypothetical protein